jgi:fructose-1-phosphate kinase PfkB-like protein
VFVYLDANDSALLKGSKAKPYMVKTNLNEASKVVEFTINDHEDMKRAALPFLRMGISYFALTMGESGLLLASQKEMICATPPKVQVKNAAGSGDALMGALIYAHLRPMPLVEVARWAVAAGTASVETEGISEFTIERVQELLPLVEVKVVNVM